jgi:hypothetical protein
MTSKKLGALLRSVPPATAPVPAEAPAMPAMGSPPDAAAASRPPRSDTPPQQREPEVPLQVLIPRHIRTQLAVKAAHEGHSLRAMVLKSLRSLGIEVTDEEIRDKRGRRPT